MGIFAIYKVINLGYTLATGHSILHDVIGFYADTDWTEIAEYYPW